MSRYLSIWFPSLVTERAIKLRPQLELVPFVVAMAERGRLLIKAAGPVAWQKEIRPGMVVADARAILPDLKVFRDRPGVEEKLLGALAEWCFRFTPTIAIDLPDGLILDISGCPHLWGGEQEYRNDIIDRLHVMGYTVRVAIADTIGAAWAVARYGKGDPVVRPGHQKEALLSLPPAALRLSAEILERMRQLGFRTIAGFIDMPGSVLRRRFGQELINRIDQALGLAIELPEPVQPAPVFRESLPCLEPVKTRSGIEFALKTLLDALSKHLLRETKGLRTALFTSYRLDGRVQQVGIGTNRPVRDVLHLLKLFEQKLDMIRPGLGIEQFVLEAPEVEDLSVRQESLWAALGGGSEREELANLLDRITGRIGEKAISRYLPAARYWPERSVQPPGSVFEKVDRVWPADRPRPVYLLPNPERVNVMAPIPDYPPMLFVYKGKVHHIKKADGPERIEREWWVDPGLVRDYYIAEDEDGARYWLFRSGYYDQHKPEWFLHGFFA